MFAEVIKSDGKGIPDVVKRWVELYERNQKSATAELLTLLFEVIIFCECYIIFSMIYSVINTAIITCRHVEQNIIFMKRI